MNRHRLCSCNQRTTIIFLLAIFIICLIPTIYIYFSHGLEEFKGYQKSILNDNNYKASKQLAESTLFIGVGIGYIIGTIFILLVPKSKVFYIVILVGTIAVISIYFFRIFGIPIPDIFYILFGMPIPETTIVIRDLSTDWRDVATKIPQAILLIPISMLYVIRATKLNKT